MLAGRLFTDGWVVPGWSATILAIMFLGGVQLLCTGILGEYIGRIYMQSKGRPLYVVGEIIESNGSGRGARVSHRGSNPHADDVTERK